MEVPESPHLATLKSILEEANIEVLVSEKRRSSWDDQEWLVPVSSEHPPSLVIQSLDQRMLANDAPLSGFPGYLPLDIPVIVAAQNFEAAQIRTMLELGATDFITPPLPLRAFYPEFGGCSDTTHCVREPTERCKKSWQCNGLVWSARAPLSLKRLENSVWWPVVISQL